MTIIELFQKLLRFKSITPNDDGAFDFIEEYLGSDWTCIKVDMEGVKNRFYYKKAASPLFISCAPLAVITPSTTSAANGSTAQPSPVGTTSM